MKLKSITGIVAYQQCCGCGACAWSRPSTYQMMDVVEHGLRPVLRPQMTETVDDAEGLKVCPGFGLEHEKYNDRPGLVEGLLPGWGPVLEVWEGYASEPHIGHTGSSGGVETALALHQLESGEAQGVLHIRGRKDAPHLNGTVFSQDRSSVLDAMGSRYSPASPCEGLGSIELDDGPCVFIGKPCDVAATGKAGALSLRLEGNLGLTVAIFGACTPSTACML